MFGLFSKKSSQDKALAKAKKFSSQGRWSEALSWYEEVMEAVPESADARSGARECRTNLVDFNLEEADLLTESDVEKAREHILLAIDLAGNEVELQKRAKAALKKVGEPKPKPKKLEMADEKPKRLFEPSCGGCASPDCAGEGEEFHEDFDDVYFLYLESMPESERDLFEERSEVFREGFVALQQGEEAKAKKLLKQAVKDEPGAAAAHFALGLLEGMGGKLEQAQRSYEKALELAPEFNSAVMSRCSALRELGRAPEVEPIMREWLKGHPTATADAVPLLAASLLDQNKVAEAEEVLAPVFFDEGKENISVAMLWARTKEMEGDLDGALRAYQMINEARPDSIDTLIPMGILLIRQGGKAAESAVGVFKKCYRLDPENGWFHLTRIGEAYAARGWPKEARKMLDQAREELPDDKNAKNFWHTVNEAIKKI